MKTFVLYHAHCADGFASAFAAWCALGDSAEYIPVSYDEPPPEMPAGSRVFIVDFSYPREVLEALWKRTSLLTILDHHKTAEAALAGLGYAHFDMEKSGAVLAWEHFQGQGNCIGPVPMLLLYVQDRDLWRWELPNSHDVSAGLALVPRDFETWHIMADEVNAIARLVAQGQIVRKAHAALIAQICDHAHADVLATKPVETPCIVVNTPVLQSECCHELLQRFPGMAVAAAFFHGEQKLTWSLRSRKGGADVSAIAQQFGGGGHACAAGFTEEL